MELRISQRGALHDMLTFPFKGRDSGNKGFAAKLSLAIVCCGMLSSEMSSPLNEGDGLTGVCLEAVKCVLGHVLNSFLLFSPSIKKELAAPLLPKKHRKFWNLK